ncbi:ABC transporter substrate-binding protein [Streptomyces albipurpureus]|uniref:ABC transporter substrate-binding protein n=1 Tax=Streptomyces albipurpureus TaxID=2897419 RepID=A0ABT0UHL4_9ACTN|nr:ABC transporter substrate-binding protein [Streptomyces sp. CWNU-1]MCM2386801.1 ABC transporter substrate-binding protein [Streptomyces sp. CWNU-1]
MNANSVPSGARRLTVTLVVGTLALTACSGVSQDKKSTDQKGLKVTELTPKAAGSLDRITWAVTAEPSSFDWIYNASFETGQIMANVCEGLMRLAPDMSVEPALAESFTNPTPTTWVYKVRPGVTFHDGTELTAEDVAFSLNRNLDTKAGSFWSGAYENVSSVKVSGPLEVTVALKQPDALFNSYLSSPAGIVGSKATVTAKGKAYGTPDGGVNCVGPFSLSKWDKGQSMTLKRDDNYFDPAHKAKSKEVVFRFVRDPAAMVNGLLSDSIDGSWFLPPSAIKRLSSSGKGSVYYGKSTQGFNAIVMNTEGPLRDVRIRQALSMAIDRKGIIDAVISGAGQPQKAPAVPGSWGYAEEKYQQAWDGLKVTEQNLEAAKKLVADAGAPSKPIVVATTSAEAEVPVIGAEIQSAAKKIGLDVQIKSVPADQYNGVYTDKKAREGIDLYLTGWGTDFADPLQMYQYFQTDHFYNFSGFSNPKYDDLIVKAGKTQDQAQRADLVTAAQKIVVDELVWIPLYAPYNTLFLNKRVTGTPASYVQLHYPWAAHLGASS